MPPTRRSRVSSGPAAKGSQKTISFAGNSKVTKATTSASSKSKDIDITPTSSKPLEISSDIDSTPGHVSSEAAVLSQAKVELEKEKTEDEKKAEKVTNAQIRKYWRERENERTAARVHQEELSVEEKVLRLFDMSSQFGPAIGIARMKRWIRANKLGLAPPIEVLAVLLKEEKKGNSQIERAYVDELMSSKFVIGEA